MRLGMGKGQHPGRSEGGESIGIERSREHVRELAGREGVEGVVGVDRTGHWV
jgi:hypothetical protein